MPRMTLQLYDRRKRMLDAHYAGVLTKDILREASANFNLPVDTLRKDWNNRPEWEPLIWRVKEAEPSAEQLLYHLRLAREKAVNLMTTADNDNARVGAIKVLTEVVTREVELRQSLSMLPQRPLEINQKVDVELGIDAVLRDFKSVIRSATRRDLQALHSAEQVDSGEPQNPAS